MLKLSRLKLVLPVLPDDGFIEQFSKIPDSLDREYL